MKIASRAMSLIAGVAMAGPWGGVMERFAVKLGHRLPGSRIVRSFCLHCGLRLLDKSPVIERIAVLTTGGKMFLHPVSATVQYYFLGSIICAPAEIPVERLFKRALREGDVFFDIGANVGFYAFLAAPLCGKSGAIHAFEANPALRQDLVRSAELNGGAGRIAINSCAVGASHGGEITLYMPSSCEEIGIPSTIPHEWLDSGTRIAVPQVSVDGYMRDHGLSRLDAVKIDIEGGELNAFKGMVETFRTVRPSLVICELMGPTVMFGQGDSRQRSSLAGDHVEIMEFMHSMGYGAWRIRAIDGKLDCRMGPDDVARTFASLGVFNICFARNGLTEERPELFASG